MPPWSCLGKFPTDLVANSTNSLTPVCLRQHSKQVGIIHSPRVLFPFRGQEHYSWVSLVLIVQNTGGGNFFQPALNWKVSLRAFLCAIPSAPGVACHAAFSPESEGFCLLPPFPGIDGLSSIIFKWVALPACLALGSDFFLCLVLEIRLPAVSSSPLPFLQVVGTVIVQLRTLPHTGPLSSKTAFAMNSYVFSSSFQVYTFCCSICSLHLCLILACSVK